MPASSYQRTLAGLGAGAALTGIGLQFAVAHHNLGPTLGLALLKYYGYFTIWTNTLVAVWLGLNAFGGDGPATGWARRPGMGTALTGYILLVGVVYQLVLRPLHEPFAGAARVADELLHTVVPFLAALYWARFVAGAPLRWTQIPAWLLYPLVYLAYTLLRGPAAGWYPYPFVDVPALGYPAVARNCLLILLGFLAGLLVLVALSRRRARRLGRLS